MSGDVLTPAETERLAAAADRIRHRVVDLCASAVGGHLGGALSCVDILTVLYFSVLRIDPGRPDAPDRDVFVLGKGHAAVGLYAALAERGFFDPGELAGYGVDGSRFMGHPVTAVPGVEVPTGSLGHGLSLGLGFALAARLDRSPRTVYVLVGDGELQEGSCWEAIMCAAAQGVPNLVAVVDRNGMQLGSPTESVCALEPLAQRWRDFGWRVREVDGHDHSSLRAALRADPEGPTAVLAETVKGRGLPFAAGQAKSHYATLSPRMRERAHRALRSGRKPGPS
ncbi:MAG TPA: transketolase [Glycomyces sp.]|nr:transketolase [Glycomyces sp.]